MDRYPLPSISPLVDIDQWRDLLLAAVDEALDRRDVWDDADADAALGFVEDLKLFISLLEQQMIFRYDYANWQFQRSNDDGATWSDATDVDPRFVNPIFSPRTDANLKCEAAASIVTQARRLMDALIAELGAGGDTINLIAILDDAAHETGVGTAAPAIFTFAAALYSVGAATLTGAFTDDAYAAFECALFCASGDDGLYDVAGYQALRSALPSIGGIAAIGFRLIADIQGSVGLSNWGTFAPHSGADCSDCDC